VTDTWESYNSLNHFALNFMQYITEFITYTDAFMIEKLLLQLCYTYTYIVIQWSFEGFLTAPATPFPPASRSVRHCFSRKKRL
jgi:hypothetical protein